MKIIDLAKEYRVYLCCAVLFLFLIVWGAVFFPQRVLISRLKADKAATALSLKEMDFIMLAYSGDARKTLEAMTRQLSRLNARFPDSEMEVVSEITAAARKNGLESVSVTPQDKVVFQDAAGQKLSFSGRTIYTVEVDFTAAGTYYEFCKYLEYLYKSAPALINISEIRFVKDKGSPGMIIGNININVFLSI